MYSFELCFYKREHHKTINDLAHDLALVAFGLLGEVDKFWTQHILDGCVKMSFLHKRHKRQFRERWATLNEADWYKTWADSPDHAEEHEDEPILSVFNRYTNITHISFEAQLDEVEQIETALMVWGFPNVDYFELTNISMQSKLIKLDQLAEKCGVEDFDGHDLEYDGENRRTPVLLSSSNPNQLAAFKLAIESMGGI